MDSSKEITVEESLLMLGALKASQVKQFQKDIRSCPSEAKKYELCLSKRDELLKTKNGLEIECGYYEPTFSESATYKVSRNSDETWQEFVGTAAQGSKNRLRITRELGKVAGRWGKDLIQYYSVGERGVNFAIQFALTAKQHSNWSQILPRFQQLVWRRIGLSAHGRHTFCHPLELTDLTNARLWTTDGPYVKQNDPEEVSLPFTTLNAEQLPHGYGFDRFGLIVPQRLALQNGINGTRVRNLMVPTSDMKSGKTTSTADDRIWSATDTSCSEATSDTTPQARVDSPALCCTSAAFRSIINVSHDGTDDGTEEAVIEEANDPDTNGISVGGSIAIDTAPTNVPLRRSLRSSVKHYSNNSDSGGDGVGGEDYDDDSSAYQHKKASFKSTSRRKGCGGARNNRNTHQNLARGKRKAAPRLEKYGLNMGRLKTLAAKLSHIPASGSTAPMDITPVSSKRKRATSLPPDIPRSHPSKRQKPDGRAFGVAPELAQSHDSGLHPACDSATDEEYLAQAISEVWQRSKDGSSSRGSQTALCLLPVLQACKHPCTDEGIGMVDAQVLSGHQAKILLDSTTPDVPIIMEHQQHFRWKSPGRPILEFFEWIGDHSRTVSVQVPSLDASKCSYESHSVQEVYQRFLPGEETDNPWNLLDCSCPVPSTLPDCLTGKNCQLLAQVRDTVLNGGSAERAVANREEWAEWRNLESWALLSEGGHCTAPHTDSHGLGTWITIQDGLFGFLWLSRPSEDQRTRWMEKPDHYDKEQRWRYWVLKPGQTVFFPSGIIHGVFRIRRSQTLGLGGHILQWSGIDQWTDVVRQQVRFPDSTNEDMTDAWKWVPVIEDLVQKGLDRASL